MQSLIGIAALIVAVAALWDGSLPLRVPGHEHLWPFFTISVGLLPPHYGYSAYVASAGALLAPWRWVRWVCLAAALLSGNRATWVGLVAGWVYAGGRRRVLAGGILCALAVVGGLAVKQREVRWRNDPARVAIWKAAIEVARANPQGVGTGKFAVGVQGRVATKAHSDVLQLAVEQGFAAAVLVVLLVGLGFYWLPEGPGKVAVVALTAQSVIDNRLHHPVCAAVYLAAWAVAWRAARLSAR